MEFIKEDNKVYKIIREEVDSKLHLKNLIEKIDELQEEKDALEKI